MSKALDYTQYDFDLLVVQLENRLLFKQGTAWKDLYRSGTGHMLIEFYAFVGNMVLYYVERRAQEGYIDTASLRSSVIRLVRLLGYNPRRPVSAKGFVTLSLPAPATSVVPVPLWTVCKSQSGLSYLVSADGLAFQVGVSSLVVPVIQGERPEPPTFQSSGAPLQTFSIDNQSVENSSLVVSIGLLMLRLDGVYVFVWSPWRQVDNFFYYDEVDAQGFPNRVNVDAGSNVYKVIGNLDGTIMIQFGDGLFGAIPVQGTRIRVEFITSAGLAGNVYQTGLINAVGTLYDSAIPAVAVSATVSNDEPIEGGADAESLEEIRVNAPAVFATGDRFVTRQDFITVLSVYPGVLDVNVWGENEENPPNYSMFNRVKICLLSGAPTTPTPPAPDLRDRLEEFLYSKSLITVKYTFVDATLLHVVVSMSLKIKTGYSASAIRSSITSKMASQFTIQATETLPKTTSLGWAHRLSDLVALVDDTLGVDYVHLQMILTQLVVSGSFVDYTGVIQLSAAPVFTGSVQVFVNGLLVGVDNGSGVLVTASTLWAVSGTIDYLTGMISVGSIASTPPGTSITSVRVRYRQSVSETLTLHLYDAGSNNVVVASNLVGLPVQNGSVVVLNDNSVIGNDDGAGAFVGASGFLVTGTINYLTGAVSLTVQTDPFGGPLGGIDVQYRKAEASDIVPNKDQVCLLEAVEFTDLS